MASIKYKPYLDLLNKWSYIGGIDIKHDTKTNTCPYCGDGMEPTARYNAKDRVWEGMYACVNVECGATSPRKWAVKRKKALSEIKGVVFELKNDSRSTDSPSWTIDYTTHIKGVNDDRWEW